MGSIFVARRTAIWLARRATSVSKATTPALTDCYSLTASFTPQRHHGTDPRRPAGGDVAGNHCHNGNEGRGAAKREVVEGTFTLELSSMLGTLAVGTLVTHRPYRDRCKRAFTLLRLSLK
jgi:hypothetical protein